MIRNGRAFFISLVLHTAIAAAAIFALQSFTKEPPGEEAKLCIALTCLAEPVAKAPIEEPVPTKSAPKSVTEPKPKPKPEKVASPSPKKPAEVKPHKTPHPVVKEDVAKVTLQEPECEPVERSEEAAEEVTAENTTETEEETAPEAVAEVMPAEEHAPEPVPSISAGERYLKQHLAIISQLLQENLYYPRMARKRGITGDVLVSFELLGSGEAVRVSVISGDTSILNHAAVTTIERLSGRFPKPGEPIILQVPIRYRLQ